jgi:hypothetical protein
MRSSIASWTFGNAPIEQAFALVSSAGYTGIDLTATAHIGRRAASPGQGMQGDGEGEELEALDVELDLITKCDAGPVAQLEHRVAGKLGRGG